MNNWEKFKIFSNATAAVLIPLVVVLIGHWYSESIRERELQGRFVELSVKILSAEPRADTKNLREWATLVIDKYSGVAFSPEARNDLVQSIPIVAISKTHSQCAEYIRRGNELLKAGDHEGGIAYLNMAEEICGTQKNND